MKIIGYCHIKKNATTGKAKNIDSFLGKNCPVIEFDDNGGVLAINPEGTSIGMFEKDDILQRFKCIIVGDVICPPELDEIGQLMHVTKVTMRKGGYNHIIKGMVILKSLMKGKVSDEFLYENNDLRDAFFDDDYKDLLTNTKK